MNEHQSASEVIRIPGALFADDRGTLRFVNDFSFKEVKRFYQVENFSLATIRAFHGHMKEAKYVYVSSGSIILCAVQLDQAKDPSKTAPVQRMVLSAAKPEVVYIPPKHANGFKALEEHTKLFFFSTSTLEESRGDDYRYPADYWGIHLWQVEDR
jgi:dTDP-4-dehydrorhamnose 3,5-epimerase-like enzyme